MFRLVTASTSSLVHSPAPLAARPALPAAAAAALPGRRVRPGPRPLSAAGVARAAGRPPVPSWTSAAVISPKLTSTDQQTIHGLTTHTPLPNATTTEHDSRTQTLTNSQWSLLGTYKDTQSLLTMHGIETNPGPARMEQITTAHVNINSITTENKIAELEQFIITNDIKILALTETKLDNSVAESRYKLDDFHQPMTKHRTRHGGGVALYVHKSLPIQRLTTIESGDEEWVWVKIKTPKFALIISTIYLPPNLPTDRRQTFLDNLTETICRAQIHAPTAIILMGDFNAGNIYLNDSTQQHSGITPFDQSLKDTAQVLGMSQLISQPTRITNNTKNLRDLIFTSNIKLVKYSGTYSSFANLDHFPIFAELDLTQSAKIDDDPTITIWDYQKMDTELLTRQLLNSDWTSMMSKNVDTATSEFIALLHDAADAAIPKIQLIRKKHDKYWATSELKRHIRKRERLFKLAKQKQTEPNWSRWRNQRNLVTALNRRLKNDYMRKKVQTLLSEKQNLHKYHKTLREIMGRNQNDTTPPLLSNDDTIVTDDQQKLNLLNEHFLLQSTLDVSNTRLPPAPTTNRPPAIDTITTSEQEVLQILNSLDPNKSTGPDGLPVKFLKLVALLIAKPLSQLFNKSLASGIFPAEFKKAIVKPIFKKKGSPSDPMSYRPISILSAISKIFEKIVYRNIYAHMTDHSLLTDRQSGYRKNHNTEIQLHYLTNNLYKSLDTGLDFTALYLDISKYFDKIWHKGLLHKCQNEFGITGSLLNWLRSYLSDRTQQVKIRNSLSARGKITAGCPQGSVLGPLLALIYLNDLSNRTHHDILFFADDTSLYASHTPDTLLTTQKALQSDLDEIYKYGQEWAITFNSTKTIQQTFTLKPTNEKPTLTFAAVPISIYDTHKHLGMTYSQDLRFHEHVNEIVKKVNKTLSPLYPIAKYLPRHILEQIHKAYILPHFDNYDTIYDGHITIKDISRLETLQNRTARLITGTLFRSSSDKLRLELGWDKLTTRRQIHRLELYHKISNSHDQNIPTYITDMIPHTRAHDTDMTLRNSSQHTITHSRTTTYQRSFLNRTTREWNRLPEEARQLPYYDFKKWIKKQHCTPNPPTYYSHGNKILNSFHARLRAGMTQLNAHQYKIQKTTSPACLCGFPQENINHFLFACPLYSNARREMLQNIAQYLSHTFIQKPKSTQLHVLLHGEGLDGADGRAVACCFQKFLHDTHRFSSTY